MMLCVSDRNVITEEKESKRKTDCKPRLLTIK